ncbi:MAG: hypothetical protein J3K34DRAFT_502069 [Monoraphidium minutum]|nr:MAG: hypothetical protein J3K34DRAFT_502069 [Monoraphidium minutum]
MRGGVERADRVATRGEHRGGKRADLGGIWRQGRGLEECAAFAAALLAAPGDAAGALLDVAVAAGAHSRERGLAAGPTRTAAFDCLALLALHHTGDAAATAQLLARYDACVPAVHVAARLLAPGAADDGGDGGAGDGGAGGAGDSGGGDSRGQQGPISYLRLVCADPAVCQEAAAIKGLAGAVAANVAATRGTRACQKAVQLLAALVGARPAALAEAEAAPGALAAAVGLMGGSSREARVAALAVVRGVARGVAASRAALLRLPALAALAALLQREADAGACPGGCAKCSSAFAAAAGLTLDKADARTLAALLAGTPGALAAVAQQLEAAVPSVLMDSDLEALVFGLCVTCSDNGEELGWRLSAAAAPALLPTAARALAACLAASGGGGGAFGGGGGGDSVASVAWTTMRESRTIRNLAQTLSRLIDGWRHVPDERRAAMAAAAGWGAEASASAAACVRAATGAARAAAPGLQAALLQGAAALRAAQEPTATPPPSGGPVAAAEAAAVEAATESSGGGSSRHSSGGGSGASGSDASGSGCSPSEATQAAAATPAPAPPPLSCLQCGGATMADGARLKLCKGCRSVRFCSDACLNLGWKAGHKAQCVALKAARLQRAQQEARQEGPPAGVAGGGP